MPSNYKDRPLDLTRIRTRPLAGRASKVTLADFARPYSCGTGVRGILDSLPNILGARAFTEVVSAIVAARDTGKPVVWGMGGHVIKCGLAPTLLSLMHDGFVTAFAMNGSAAIHDSEVALGGATSEEVEAVLADGSFGTADETGRVLQAAATMSVADGIGLGEALGRKLRAVSDPASGGSLEASVLASASAANVPVTVHVAIGTDTPHIHPALDPAALGAATHLDFRLFCELVRQLEGGGIYLNLGSAVMMPEVFLKAVTAVRNLGHPLAHFSTANFDFLQHYRPTQNVVRRPVADGGKGWAITGHHEIMVPLLAAALAELAGDRVRGGAAGSGR